MAWQLDDLLYLMARLRDPQTGCPWDLKQDFASVLPHTLEEAYEVADAIERQDWQHLEEELGDLLFQVVFYGQMGDEQRYFSMASIIDRLVTKLIRRHPHVFPEGTLASQRTPGDSLDDDGIRASWDRIKQEEKAGQPPSSRLLDSVPTTLPAMSRAVKLQKKAATVGFDWPDPAAIVAKIEEELQEVRDELISGDRDRLQAEIGDLLFAVTNLARHYRIDPEESLRGTNLRFRQRFEWVEQRSHEHGGWQQITLDDMESWWQEAKKRGY